LKRHDVSEEATRILSYLHSIVIALALTSGIKALVSPTDDLVRSPFALPVDHLLLFLTFTVTLVPFYHGGALVFIRIRSAVSLGRQTLLVHLGVLLSEAAMLFGMAVSLFNIIALISWFILLLIVDCAWVGLVHVISPEHGESVAPKAWGLVNIVMIIFLIAFWNLEPAGVPRYVLLLTAALLRTGVDYYLGRDYYFPSG